MSVKVINSNIVTAFDDKTIGTKVDRALVFLRLLFPAIERFDFAAQRIPGQGVIVLPQEATRCVISGVGYHTGNPDHYVIRRHWSGKVHMYLKRNLAAPCAAVAAVVDTRAAYLADPDVACEAGANERKRIEESDATHVLLAVLTAPLDREGGFAKKYDPTKPPPLTPSTFVRNLAGHNNLAADWTADEIRAKAREIEDYHGERGYCTVAD